MRYRPMVMLEEAPGQTWASGVQRELRWHSESTLGQPQYGPAGVDMCEYCGCQQIDVIAELTAEHDRLRELGRDLAAAAKADDLHSARSLAVQMRTLLGPHTRVEELALFPALHADFSSQIDDLVAEHRSIDTALDDLTAESPSEDWPAVTLTALAHLFDHILKEQDGVFPAALGLLAPDDWESIARVRERVHHGASGIVRT